MGELKPGITVVIPAYNEEQNLPAFLPDLLHLSDQRGWTVVVVNDGSTDGTRTLLEGLRERKRFGLHHHKLNRGYGAALKTGIKSVDTDFVITVDADGQHSLEDIERLYHAMIASDADMIIGSRQGLRSASRFRGFGKWIIRKIAGVLLPVTVYDLNSGMKVYRTELAQKYVDLCPDSMAFSDIIVLLFISQRHLVREVPISIRERTAGQSTIGIQTAFETVLEIVNILMLFNPLKIFLPLSLGLWGAGIVTTMVPVIRGKGISVAGSMTILVGTICLLLGLVAEQLSALRKRGLC
jgi:glycosyltransferase involved in cell wall biosynthesis